jgi:hypothetical protein
MFVKSTSRNIERGDLLIVRSEDVGRVGLTLCFVVSLKVTKMIP